MQGSQQFHSARRKMLAAYDAARSQNPGKRVQVDHGIAAEAAVRQWLTDFLPKRYAVTSGYVICQRLSEDDELKHYDVIIYDALNSPVLWVDDIPGKGRIQAIPSEHVLSVWEVKAAMTKRAVVDAVKKLAELRPLLAEVDDPAMPIPAYLPATFFSAIVFFELRREELKRFDLLDVLQPAEELRGFAGSLVLRCDPNGDQSGFTRLFPADAIDPNGAPFGLRTSLSALLTLGKPFKVGEHWKAESMQWTPLTFSMFAFEVIARLAGKYDGTPLSFHGSPISLYPLDRDRK